ncbi:MAG TPA: hypothetical protein EYP58_02770, partial [bacterium (Candidatus Stahlbacteria)]|nr:hypothetical protein [Candidatus Stahlbacteria bacterium]
MRIRIIFEPICDTVTLPIHYHYCLQGFIYRNLKPDLARELHDKGQILGKRRFKMFVFSQVLKRGRKVGEELRFAGQLGF